MRVRNLIPALMTLAAVCIAPAAFAQKSTTGPLPAPDLYRGDLERVPTQAILSGVPAYIWHHGCGPTALGMVVGYWDGMGYPDLIPGSAAVQNATVNAIIADDSGNANCDLEDGDHYQDYSCPRDADDYGNPTVPEPLDDRSTTGGAHTSDCLADYMRTSWSSESLFYGWSYSSAVPGAFLTHVANAAPEYVASAQNHSYDNFSFEDYKEEIDAGRPVMLLVDTNADGETDHFVTGVGYDDVTSKYGVHDTFDQNIWWFEWRRIQQGRLWGVHTVTTFRFSQTSTIQITLFLQVMTYGNPSQYRLTARVEDENGPRVGEDVTLTTTRGTFPNGLQSYSTVCGVTGEADANITTVDFGPVQLCCYLDNQPDEFECMETSFPSYPPPSMAPFDTLSLIVSANIEYGESGGLEWDPNGGKIAGGVGTQVKLFSYPEGELIWARPLPAGRQIHDLSYDASGTMIAACDEDYLYRIDAVDGSLHPHCETPLNDPNQSVDAVSSSTLLVGRWEGPACQLQEVNGATCSQVRCFQPFPKWPGDDPNDIVLADVTRCRRASDGRVAAVTSEVWGTVDEGGRLGIYSSGGALLRYYTNQVPNESRFLDCDWLDGGSHVVACGENFAAIYGANSNSITQLAATNNVVATTAIEADRVAIADLRTVRVFNVQGSPLGEWSGSPFIVDLDYDPHMEVLAAGGASVGTFLFNLSDDQIPPFVGVPSEIAVPAGIELAELSGTVTDATTEYLSLRGSVDGAPFEDIQIAADGTFIMFVPLQDDTTDVTFIAEDFYRQRRQVETAIYRDPFPEVTFIRSDFDASGEANITDPLLNLAYLIAGGAPPSCLDAADVDDSGEVNISDPLVSLQHLFAGGSPPPAPYPDCGTDPTQDPIECSSFPWCGSDLRMQQRPLENLPMNGRLDVFLRDKSGSPVPGLVQTAVVVESSLPLAALEFSISFDPKRYEFVGVLPAAAKAPGFLAGAEVPAGGTVRIGYVEDLALQRSLLPGGHEIATLLWRPVNPLDHSFGDDLLVNRSRFVGADFTSYDGGVPGDGGDVRQGAGSLPFESEASDVLQAPNPYRPGQIISLRTAVSAEAELAVFDVSGRCVQSLYRGQLQRPGTALIWDGRYSDGRSAASGVYYLSGRLGSREVGRTILLVK